ncbi:MAG TPA: aminoglycoside phosphotransferase family protein [Anaerolineales bacterium]|nr:aminoglycoside phosphotransferase family protein [Anaerolineales bacterium]
MRHFSIAHEFYSEGSILDIREFGNGNINDTYLVTTDATTERHFILQRINTHVFKQPQLIMQNMRIFTDHMRKRASDEGLFWEMPRVLNARDGRDYYLDMNGDFWRAIGYVKGAQSFESITDVNHAREVGHALGTFQYLISDLSVDQLADTLEGFHITPRYLRQFDHASSQNAFKKTAEVKYCINFVEQRRRFAHTLEHAREQGKLQLRVMHGDPKVNNVMIDETSGRAISLVDLDTVKPGLIHYDIGDCMRSGCNPLGEDAEDWEAVHFDPKIGAAILEGYLTQARNFLTASDYEYLFDSIRLLAFELGIRFFADYLAGDVYFKVKHPEHNLHRALVQFRLTESIESHETDIRNIIGKVVEMAD